MGTRVGYAGGTKENPTYYSLGDHAETIQIDYDPTQVSYEELLDVFWQSHNATSQPYSRQYRSIVFYHDEEQRSKTEESRDREAARRGVQILTEIMPAAEFTLAEGYHQKYRLQQATVVMDEFMAIHPAGGWIDSAAAARVNGYLGGYGSLESLQSDRGSWGLTGEAAERLLDSVRRWQR